ncbi:hypothetical protein ACQ4PT_019892 [Festuca glaucescens]
MEANMSQATADAEIARPAPPALPWTVQIQLFILVGAYNIALRADGTVNRFLFSLGDWKTRASARPDALGVRSADVTVEKSRGLWARVFSPAADQAGSPLPVIVYTHGGGFALLSPASRPLDGMCRRFCRELGAVVVSVNYRLAPEHRYPAAYDDGVEVLRYLSATGLPDDLGVSVDLSRCFLVGDSAGGNIAHHVAQRWISPSNSIRLAGIILLQPYFGGEERTKAELRLEGVDPVVNMKRSDWSWRAFLPEGANRDHTAAHVTDGNAELPEGFPPAMVVVGGFDSLQDWQRRYAGVLQQKGKMVQLLEYPEAIHAFYMFPKLPDTGKLLKEMKAFIQSKTSN